MNKGLYFLTFILGAAGGSFVTYKLLKNKYEEIAQEEIDSVKEMYRNAQEDAELDKSENEGDDPFIYDPKKMAKKSIDKPDIMEYSKKVEKLNYSEYSKSKISDKLEVGPDPKDTDDPYVISPEEFGEDDTYDTINLTYYADGVLADENDEEVENVDGTIGLDSLETFGTYEDDSVHVKNDRLRAYYEILRDERNYEDVMAGRPDPTDFYE